MPEIEVTLAGQSYRFVVEPGSEERVRSHVATLDAYADRLLREHGRIERSLLVLMASIQALDDRPDLSGDEAVALMERTTIALREAAGRLAMLTEQSGAAPATGRRIARPGADR